MYLNGVFCSFHFSKDLRDLFVLKQVTSLLHLHITNLTGARCRPEELGDPLLSCYSILALLPVYLFSFVFKLSLYLTHLQTFS